MSSPANAHEPGRDHRSHRDWVFVLADPGGVVSLSVHGEGREQQARVVIFLDSGQTLWYDSEIDGRRMDFSLAGSGVSTGGFSLTVRTGQLRAPAEIGEGGVTRRANRVPVILQAALSPLALAAVIDDATGAGGEVRAQGFRVGGTLAVGSVIRPVSGQVWTSRSGFAGPGVESGSRLQAVFQEGSSLYAARTGSAPASGRLAALQVHNRISRLPVPAIRVDGPQRSVPLAVTCELGDPRSADVTGAPRHIEGYQHVAFLRPGRTPGEQVRVGYTPLDFVRAGTTGFGLLEHVVRLGDAAVPQPEPELPDPWN